MWAPTASQAGVSGIAALAWMPTAQSQINAANNQLTVSGVGYDAGGGNQNTFLGTSTSSPIEYDAENRQVYVKDGLSNVFLYTYDGLGQRVSRTENSGTPTTYVHDVFGNLAAEYNPVSPAACTTCYLSWDHLGSTRMVTDGSTTDGTTGQIVARHDFLPFGVEIPRSWSVTDGLSPRFTGQDHDAETSLEFYQARYLAAGLGRFMSTDPGNAGADLTDPQTWNMYGYVRNNPLVAVDPDGLDSCLTSTANTCMDVIDTYNSTPTNTSPNGCYALFVDGLFVSSNCGGGGAGSGAGTLTQLTPPVSRPVTPVNKGACVADSVVNLAIAVSPYENFAAAVGLAAAVSGRSFTPVQGFAGGSFFSKSNPFTSFADTSNNVVKANVNASFEAAGGVAKLNRLADLTTRSGFGLKSASRQARDLAALASITNKAKIAEVVPVVGNAIAGIAAVSDIHGCLSGPK